MEHLAADALMGRDTGEPGGRMAAAYVAEQFARYGLRPLPGHDEFTLPFTLYRAGFEPARTFVRVGGGSAVTGACGEDMRPFSFSDAGVVEADVVFAGYSITAPDLGYDDYEDLDVTGKLVLVFRHEPLENDPDSPFDGTTHSPHALFTTKARNADSHGARGMILVTDPLNHGAGEDFRAGGPLALDPPAAVEPDTSEAPFLAVHVSAPVAAALIESSGRSLAEMQQGLDDGTLKPSDVSLGAVRARVALRPRALPEAVEAHNVAAYIEGRDAELRRELVVVGAHHDHLGGHEGEGDTVYNGADDNASGTAGVLAIAEAFAASDARPLRSLVFMTFSGEERGLLGSRAAVRDGQIPIERVRFMLNLDMIGRNPTDPLTVIGDGLARGLRRVVEHANLRTDLDLQYMGTRYMGNSDHDVFYRHDVPFVMLFTGLHDDYHRVSDHPEKLDYERLRRIVELGASLVGETANADRLPHLIHRVSWLGVEVEVLGAEDSREAKVTRVEPSSRAEKAGFRTGDVLLAFASEPLHDPDAVGAAFRKISPGTETTIDVRRDGERRRSHVARARTGYVGIWPGDVDADLRTALGLGPNEGVRVRQVVGGGPADSAGLKSGDVLLAIEGRPVVLGTLREVLAQIGAGEVVDVLLVRGGERLTLPLTLGERPRPN